MSVDPQHLARILHQVRAIGGPAAPQQSIPRQPVHTVYGGAHLFRAELATKLGNLARRSLSEYAPEAKDFSEAFGVTEELAAQVRERVLDKLTREPVEDLRIDFEDGFGPRPDDEEDRVAQAAATELAKGLELGSLPPFIGLRIKPLTPELAPRALRTLELFLTTLAERSERTLPPWFVVTLPKVTRPQEVAALAEMLELLEEGLGFSAGTIGLELMVEHPAALFDLEGRLALPALVAAAKGRCRAAHFGAYDYTASLAITATHQTMRHPACDFVRHVMQVSLAESPVFLSDGATTTMPVPIASPERGATPSAEMTAANRRAVHAAWRLHADNVRHGLSFGFYQGWDLHPAQLPARYAALFEFFLQGHAASAQRLRAFLEKASQATLVGNVFDDAATGQGLLNYFLRGLSTGALAESEVLAVGLTREELAGRSFTSIVERRRRS